MSRDGPDIEPDRYPIFGRISNSVSGVCQVSVFVLAPDIRIYNGRIFGHKLMSSPDCKNAYLDTEDTESDVEDISFVHTHSSTSLLVISGNHCDIELNSLIWRNGDGG